LPQSFVENYGDGVCEVQAAHVGIHYRYLQAPVPIGFQEVFRQPAGFSPEDDAIVAAKRKVNVRSFGVRGEINKPGVCECRMKTTEISMSVQNNLGPIIETRSLNCPIVHSESRNSDNVQRGSGRRTESRNISGVLRDLGLD